MSKSTVTARATAKSAMLAAKRERAQNAHADAIAYCDETKMRGTERAGYIAFASTAMQAGSARGAIAQAVLTEGKSGVQTYAAIAKKAKVSLADMSHANLAYIARNVEFRKALVGFTLSFDAEKETVTLRTYRAEAAKPRKAKKAPAPSTEGTEAA